MKKYKFMSLLAVGCAILSGTVLSSCSNDDADALTGGYDIKSLYPTKVIPGQEVTITGNGLDGVTEVEFPGGQKVSEIKKIGGGMISVKTPAGVQAGPISVINKDNNVITYRDELTIGKPSVTTIAPLDKAVKIGENIQVYGSDLEFMSEAIFPGEDGSEVRLPASLFNRKSTSVLLIPVPDGVLDQGTDIKIVDCAGSVYPINGITLSAEKATGGNNDNLVPFVVWEGDFEVTSWNWWEPNPGDFDWKGITLEPGMTMKFIISDAQDDSRFCYCRGNWAGIDLGGENDPNNIGIPAGGSEVEITLTEDLISDFLTASPVAHISGTNYHLKQVVVMAEPQPVTLWEGEEYIQPGWANWIYLKPADGTLNFGSVTPKVGDILTIYTAPHDNGITFCLCLGDGWWAPDLDGAGNNTITVPGGQNEVSYVLTDTAVENLNSQLILGGDNWTVVKVTLTPQ